MGRRSRDKEQENFVPYDKQSRKEKREQDKKRRGTWGAVNPITRPHGQKNDYKRQRQQEREDDMIEDYEDYDFD